MNGENTLTDQQAAVLQLYAAGQSPAAVGAALCIRVHEVLAALTSAAVQWHLRILEEFRVVRCRAAAQDALAAACSAPALDPVKRRIAATTLLRSLRNPPPPRRSNNQSDREGAMLRHEPDAPAREHPRSASEEVTKQSRDGEGATLSANQGAIGGSRESSSAAVGTAAASSPALPVSASVPNLNSANLNFELSAGLHSGP